MPFPNYAQFTPEKSGSGSPTAFGTLRGTIRDRSGRRLSEALVEAFANVSVRPKARVTAAGRRSESAKRKRLEADPAYLRSGKSDGEGRYALDRLPAGMVTVRFECPGKRPQSHAVTIERDGTTVLDIVLEGEA